MEHPFFSNNNKKSIQEIEAELQEMKSNDLPWETGKVFAYVYEPDPEAYALIKKAYMMFLTENGLDPTAFSSLLKMEQEVIDIAIQLMNGNKNSAGNFTFGGTESIILAVKTARDFAREKYPNIKNPNIVLPVTAHAAFFKACHYLSLETKIIPVDDITFIPKIEDYKNAIDENTLMLIGSSPSYAHGVVDPIEEIAALAKEKNILCHVDACVGGMYLPFLKSLGYKISNFDFSVEGVTSISLDFHKYGYTAKGASCILYKNKELRKYQIYTCSQWSGYSLVNATVLSSKTGGSLAACWANLNYLKIKGYQKIVAATQEAKIKIEHAIKEISSLYLLGNPVMNMIAFASNTIDLFLLAATMKEKGWYLQIQFKHQNSPTNIHLSINRANVPHVDNFIKELKTTIIELENSTIDNSLPFSQEILDNLTPEMVHQLKAGLGVNDGEAPSDLTIVNRILDAASPSTRDMILKEFVNGLFR